MRATSVIRTAVATAFVAVTLLVPVAAEARPAPIVITAHTAKVTSRAVTVPYSLKGSAAVTLKVQKVRGTSSQVGSSRRATGSGTVTWNRTINGVAAAPGRYVLTLTAKHGTAKSQSSTTVTLN
jgi:hypothetical protein